MKQRPYLVQKQRLRNVENEIGDRQIDVQPGKHVDEALQKSEVQVEAIS